MLNGLLCFIKYLNRRGEWTEEHKEYLLQGLKLFKEPKLHYVRESRVRTELGPVFCIPVDTMKAIETKVRSLYKFIDEMPPCPRRISLPLDQSCVEGANPILADLFHYMDDPYCP